MPSKSLERTGSLQSHPNITTAANMLGVSPATVSRREDLVRERRGERDVVLTPAEVMRLANVYRKRSLNEVGAALIAYANENAPDETASVEEQVEAFFEGLQSESRPEDDFLGMARELLPEELYREVARTVEETRDAPRPAGIVGNTPSSSSAARKPGRPKTPPSAKSKAAPRDSRPRRSAKKRALA
jgi:hypothetical protein